MSKKDKIDRQEHAALCKRAEEQAKTLSETRKIYERIVSENNRGNPPEWVKKYNLDSLEAILNKTQAELDTIRDRTEKSPPWAQRDMLNAIKSGASNGKISADLILNQAAAANRSNDINVRSIINTQKIDRDGASQRDFVMQPGKRVLASIQDLENYNNRLKSAVVSETTDLNVSLLNREDYKYKNPKQYVDDLRVEKSLLEELASKLPNGDKILEAVKRPVAGEEGYVGVFGEMPKGKGTLDRHHLIMNYKMKFLDAEGLLGGPIKYCRTAGVAVCVPEELHKTIHLENPPFKGTPYDILKGDMDRYSKVMDGAGIPTQTLDGRLNKIEELHAARFGIVKPMRRDSEVIFDIKFEMARDKFHQRHGDLEKALKDLEDARKNRLNDISKQVKAIQAAYAAENEAFQELQKMSPPLSSSTAIPSNSLATTDLPPSSPPTPKPPKTIALKADVDPDAVLYAPNDSSAAVAKGKMAANAAKLGAGVGAAEVGAGGSLVEAGTTEVILPLALGELVGTVTRSANLQSEVGKAQTSLAKFTEYTQGLQQQADYGRTLSAAHPDNDALKVYVAKLQTEVDWHNNMLREVQKWQANVGPANASDLALDRAQAKYDAVKDKPVRDLPQYLVPGLGDKINAEVADAKAALEKIKPVAEMDRRAEEKAQPVNAFDIRIEKLKEERFKARTEATSVYNNALLSNMFGADDRTKQKNTNAELCANVAEKMIEAAQAQANADRSVIGSAFDAGDKLNAEARNIRAQALNLALEQQLKKDIALLQAAEQEASQKLTKYEAMHPNSKIPTRTMVFSKNDIAKLEAATKAVLGTADAISQLHGKEGSAVADQAHLDATAKLNALKNPHQIPLEVHVDYGARADARSDRSDRRDYGASNGNGDPHNWDRPDRDRRGDYASSGNGDPHNWDRPDRDRRDGGADATPPLGTDSPASGTDAGATPPAGTGASTTGDHPRLRDPSVARQIDDLNKEMLSLDRGQPVELKPRMHQPPATPVPPSAPPPALRVRTTQHPQAKRNVEAPSGGTVFIRALPVSGTRFDCIEVPKSGDNSPTPGTPTFRTRESCDATTKR